jgi:hypothetical protein
MGRVLEKYKLDSTCFGLVSCFFMVWSLDLYCILVWLVVKLKINCMWIRQVQEQTLCNFIVWFIFELQRKINYQKLQK